MTGAYPTAYDPSPVIADVPALLCAEGESAVSRARRTLEDSGFICSAPLTASQVADRLDQLARVGLLWVELDSFDENSAQLLQRIDADVDRGRYSAVIAATPELIDPVSALVRSPALEVVIGRNELERGTALALAAANSRTSIVRDAASDESAARLRQLSEEVSRIAATLARLSGEEPRLASRGGTEAPAEGELPVVPAEHVRAIIRARRRRGDFLPADLFADPAWDMLLDLLQAELVQHRVPVSSLCIAAAVPATTALRWIKSMTDRGLLVRRPDPHDGRRVFMEMSRSTSYGLRRYFNEIGAALV